MMIQSRRLMNKSNKWRKDIDYRVIRSNESFRLDRSTSNFDRIDSFFFQDLLTESTVIDYLRKRLNSTDKTTTVNLLVRDHRNSNDVRLYRSFLLRQGKMNRHISRIRRRIFSRLIWSINMIHFGWNFCNH